MYMISDAIYNAVGENTQVSIPHNTNMVCIMRIINFRTWHALRSTFPLHARQQGSDTFYHGTSFVHCIKITT